jgi:antirestriction protein
MNITLYPLASYNNAILNPFAIELGGINKDNYYQEIAKGLWDKSINPNVTSTKCNDCGHIHISGEDASCNECGSEDVEHKATEEEWIVCDYEDIPSRFVGEYDIADDFWEYQEFIQNTDLDADIINAAIDIDIQPSDIEESYQGSFSSDEDFAYQMADDLGLLNDNDSWPYTCIDWERAAKDLMFDYSKSNGHYFRKL